MLAAAAAAFSVYVVARPLAAAHYPPITDLPFHAAMISILRHYADPAFHFREQFELHFMEVPYWTLHLLGALFALVLPIAHAVKLAVAVLLLLLPAGLAVMFHGMKKSPLLGLLALPLIWNTLTHWGFINFVAALGLFAMVIGFTLLVLDAPSRARSIGLAASLLLVFGTHIFRFPFALAAVAGTAVVMYPATRRVRPLLAPVLPSVAALLVWLWVRPPSLAAEMPPLGFHPERFKEIPSSLFNAFKGPDELRLAGRSLGLVAAVIVINGLIALLEKRWRRGSDRDLRWTLGVTALPVCIGGALLGMFLCLPMAMGTWWYVYPREIVGAVFIGLGLSPDLPRLNALRAPLLGAVVFGAVAQSSLVTDRYAEFDAATKDFRQITRHLPLAPKLGYLIFNHDHPRFMTHPVLHLPAWVQAERGGWLSFHMVSLEGASIRYRPRSSAVPPPTPRNFEWLPQRFDLKTRGRFFDWFLVRSLGGPDPRFAGEPSLRLVDHVGAWWLYHRE